MQRSLLACVVSVALVACSDGGGAAPTSTTRAAADPGASASLLAVGDVGDCDTDDDEQVAEVVGSLSGPVLLLGDIAYPAGTPEQFARCFDPAWKRFRERLRPVPGNHEYGTTGAAGYFDYFGPAAGEPGKGWHGFDVGRWHVVGLNSNCAAVGGCGAGSEQERWLRTDLAASTARCTVAFWHHPRFSSGSTHGSDPMMGDVWRALADAGADLVLVGHEHNYERLGPLDAAGRVDEAAGIRSFVVGTGGRSHYGFGVPHEGSEARNGNTFGVLELTLSADSHRWRFVPVGGRDFTDEGEGRCR